MLWPLLCVQLKSIILRSGSDRFGYNCIILESAGTDDYAVLGEFVAVLGYV